MSGLLCLGVLVLLIVLFFTLLLVILLLVLLSLLGSVEADQLLSTHEGAKNRGDHNTLVGLVVLHDAAHGAGDSAESPIQHVGVLLFLVSCRSSRPETASDGTG